MLGELGGTAASMRARLAVDSPVGPRTNFWALVSIWSLLCYEEDLQKLLSVIPCGEVSEENYLKGTNQLLRVF